MSFHEKSAWVCLVSVLLVYVPYFILVFQYPMAFVGLFVLAVVILVALLTGFHLLNSILTRSIRVSGETPTLDEHDRKIEMWSAKVSGGLLGFFVIVWCLNAMFGIPISAAFAAHSAAATDNISPTDFSIPATQALIWVHALFAAFVLSNLAYYSLIVAGYRRAS